MELQFAETQVVPAVQYEFTKNSRLNFERDNMGLGLSQQAKTVTARKGQKWLFFGSVCGHILYKCALIRVVIVKFFIACTYKKVIQSYHMTVFHIAPFPGTSYKNNKNLSNYNKTLLTF